MRVRRDPPAASSMFRRPAEPEPLPNFQPPARRHLHVELPRRVEEAAEVPGGAPSRRLPASVSGQVPLRLKSASGSGRLIVAVGLHHVYTAKVGLPLRQQPSQAARRATLGLGYWPAGQSRGRKDQLDRPRRRGLVDCPGAGGLATNSAATPPLEPDSGSAAANASHKHSRVGVTVISSGPSARRTRRSIDSDATLALPEPQNRLPHVTWHANAVAYYNSGSLSSTHPTGRQREHLRTIRCN